MRRLRPLWVLAMALCAGCHSPAWSVATVENVRDDVERDYLAVCIAGVEHSPPSCFPLAKALQQAEQDIEAARQAIHKGGSIAPQLSRVRASGKKVRALRKDLPAPAGVVPALTVKRP